MTKVTKGGRYDLTFAIGVVVDKYLDHLPLERQVRIMERQGLAIDSQTLWDVVNAVAMHLVPSYLALRDYTATLDKLDRATEPAGGERVCRSGAALPQVVAPIRHASRWGGRRACSPPALIEMAGDISARPSSAPSATSSPHGRGGGPCTVRTARPEKKMERP